MIHYEICPYCGQGAVRKAKIKRNGKSIIICEECDTVWEKETNDKTGISLQQFLRHEGIDVNYDDWKELDLEESNGNFALLENYIAYNQEYSFWITQVK